MSGERLPPWAVADAPSAPAVASARRAHSSGGRPPALTDGAGLPPSNGVAPPRRSAPPAGLAAVPPLDGARLALSPPSTGALAVSFSTWVAGGGGDGADEPDPGDGFDIGTTRVPGGCVSPELAAHLSVASDYLGMKKKRLVRFSSSKVVLDRPDLALQPLGRCVWADVLLPLHNGIRVVRGGAVCAGRDKRADGAPSFVGGRFPHVTLGDTLTRSDRTATH